MKRLRKYCTPAVAFIILMGIISMLSDFTHEGARSIYGQFLSLSGATPEVISFISGLGEFLGSSLILITSIIANKTKKYWLMTFVGYAINLLVVPSLALTFSNGWIYACGLILLERVGRSIRKPAKNTLVSFASKDVGAGKAFALQEFLDQIGAFLGPLLLSLVLILNKETDLFLTYKNCFLILGVPAIITLLVLIIVMIKFPHPEEQFEVNKVEVNAPQRKSKFIVNSSYIFYIVAISLTAFSFIDFPVVSYYIQSLEIIDTDYLPILYSLAMLVDAISALVFGILFDKIGLKTLIISTIISSFFSLLIFSNSNIFLIIIGVSMWGVGMGAQESILKASIATIVSKDNRSIGFGVFEFFFGFSWFIGSWLLGIAYQYSLIVMIILSCSIQISAIPFYVLAIKKQPKKTVLS